MGQGFLGAMKVSWSWTMVTSHNGNSLKVVQFYTFNERIYGILIIAQ